MAIQDYKYVFLLLVNKWCPNNPILRTVGTIYTNALFKAELKFIALVLRPDYELIHFIKFKFKNFSLNIRCAVVTFILQIRSEQSKIISRFPL